MALVYLISLGIGKSAGAPGPVWITLLSARDTQELPDEEISTPLARRRRPAA